MNQTCTGTLLGLPICECKSGWGIYPLCFGMSFFLFYLSLSNVPIDPDACHYDSDCGAYGSCSNTTKGFTTCSCKNGGLYPLCNSMF